MTKDAGGKPGVGNQADAGAIANREKARKTKTGDRENIMGDVSPL